MDTKTSTSTDAATAASSDSKSDQMQQGPTTDSIGWLVLKTVSGVHPVSTITTATVATSAEKGLYTKRTIPARKEVFCEMPLVVISPTHMSQTAWNEWYNAMVAGGSPFEFLALHWAYQMLAKQTASGTDRPSIHRWSQQLATQLIVASGRVDTQSDTSHCSTWCHTRVDHLVAHILELQEEWRVRNTTSSLQKKTNMSVSTTEGGKEREAVWSIVRWTCHFGWEVYSGMDYSLPFAWTMYLWTFWLRHSKTPNCRIMHDQHSRVFLVTIRQIETNEELTVETFEKWSGDRVSPTTTWTRAARMPMTTVSPLLSLGTPTWHDCLVSAHRQIWKQPCMDATAIDPQLLKQLSESLPNIPSHIRWIIQYHTRVLELCMRYRTVDSRTSLLACLTQKPSIIAKSMQKTTIQEGTQSDNLQHFVDCMEKALGGAHSHLEAHLITYLIPQWAWQGLEEIWRHPELGLVTLYDKWMQSRIASKQVRIHWTGSEKS